jgi:hypothetical protein
VTALRNILRSRKKLLVSFILKRKETAEVWRGEKKESMPMSDGT